jgi:SNF2 family DNA or RNA helicase
MSFDFSFDKQFIRLNVPTEKKGFLKPLFFKASSQTIRSISKEDRNLILAMGDLRFAKETTGGHLEITDDKIEMSHEVAAEVNNHSATTLGLPDLVDLTLHTDIEGTPGSTNFKVIHFWSKGGSKQMVKRTGCIINTSFGPKRIPRWLLNAVEIADQPYISGDLDNDWNKLAKFKHSLDPALESQYETEGIIELSNFMKGLKVKIADGFSILPHETEFDNDYDVIPFSQKTLNENLNSNKNISNEMAELSDRELKEFQKRTRQKGALPSYKVSDGSFLVIDNSSSIALNVICKMYDAPQDQKREFVKNPRRLISDAIEKDLNSRGVLDGLSAAQVEEEVERAAFPLFVETLEYSERVLGKTVYTGQTPITVESSDTTWLPEIFSERVAEVLDTLSNDELAELEVRLNSAIGQGIQVVDIAGENIPANQETSRSIRARINQRIEYENERETASILEEGQQRTGPVILDVAENFDQINWRAQRKPRLVDISRATPQNITSTLKSHQIESLDWQIRAWEAGLPGILNADEQGLGKTLQTLSFIAWLKAQLSQSKKNQSNGPILIVAPTSLLENWEQEVAIHLSEGSLGTLIRLYGSATTALKRPGTTGKDTDEGNGLLDLSFLINATEAGDGHNFWVLTTYTTLTHYQHSLGRVPFSLAVFDEIQALKNPGSLRARAGLAMNADFRIGLTGTPIENSTTDLWAILEQLCPGRVSLHDFRSQFGSPESGNLEHLYELIFKQTEDGLPSIALRRTKDEVARELPKKTRMLHPREMPKEQSVSYEEARDQLILGRKGSALKVLHHIRTVSVHPDISAAENDEEFINLSGRLKATFDIIDGINSKQERVIVFIEHIQMQYRFIELLKARYNLENVDVINGQTPIKKRQEVVNRFQLNLKKARGFDVLVLGPKAAGTGLTLTAATNVIHLSRWWNPAVEEQCNDRVHRIGQDKPVKVHIPMAIHPNYKEQSFDCLLHSLMTRKRQLASSALWPMGDTSNDASNLQDMLAEEASRSPAQDVVKNSIIKMFERDQSEPRQILDNNVFIYD